MTNYLIPSQTTTYACQAFDLGELGGHKHVVAVRPKLHAETKAHPHHALIHICKNNTWFQGLSAPALCQSNGGGVVGNTAAACDGLMWSWAVGFGDFILPAEAGFKIGGANGARYVVLEIHYDNPMNLANMRDHSGFELFYTNTLRANDAGVVTMADPTTDLRNTFSTPYVSGNLPVGQSLIHRQATCPSACTKQSFSQPITIFSEFLHMHHFGQKMYTEIYDNTSKFLRVSQRIDYWDNAFQNVNSDVYTLNPGDEVQTHCYMNTANAPGSGTVDFGTATGQEMCMTFVFYYPLQYKGVDSNNNPLPWSLCGMKYQDIGAGKEVVSMCGSIDQTNNNWIMANSDSVGIKVGQYGGQVARDNSNYADPSSFLAYPGTNSSAPTLSQCTPASPVAASTKTTLSQSVTFTGLANKEAYTGSIQQVYEIGYGVGIGIATAAGSYTAGCGVASVASAARRSAKVTFTATVTPAAASAATTASNNLTPSSLVTAITQVNTALGNPITPPTAGQVTVTTPAVSVSSSSRDTDLTLVWIIIGAVVGIGHSHM